MRPKPQLEKLYSSNFFGSWSSFCIFITWLQQRSKGNYYHIEWRNLLLESVQLSGVQYQGVGGKKGGIPLVRCRAKASGEARERGNEGQQDLAGQSHEELTPATLWRRERYKRCAVVLDTTRTQLLLETEDDYSRTQQEWYKRSFHGTLLEKMKVWGLFQQSIKDIYPIERVEASQSLPTLCRLHSVGTKYTKCKREGTI